MKKMMLGLALALAFTGACATAGTSGGPAGSSRDTLERDEIAAEGGQIRTAYDAVEQLRPQFLRNRPNATVGVGAATVEPVVVYVDGIQRGGVAELRNIPIERVLRIHYVRPTDAQTRYGIGHGSGVIEVTTITG